MQERSLALFGALARETGARRAARMGAEARRRHRALRPLSASQRDSGPRVDAGGTRVSRTSRVPVSDRTPGIQQPRATPIALLGGTFDPVHYGHLRFADDVRRALGLSRGSPGSRAGSAAPRQPDGAGRRSPGHAAARRRPNFPAWSWTIANCAAPARATRWTRSTELRRELPGPVRCSLLLGCRRVSRPAHLAPVARTVRPRASRRRRAARREPRGGPAGATAGHLARAPRRRSGNPVFAARGRHPDAANRARSTSRPRRSGNTSPRGRAPAEMGGGLLPPAVLAYIDRHHLYRPRSDAT